MSWSPTFYLSGSSARTQLLEPVPYVLETTAVGPATLQRACITSAALAPLLVRSEHPSEEIIGLL